MSLSSRDASGQILRNWKNESTPLKITLESPGLVFSGRGRLLDFDSDVGISLTASTFFKLAVDFKPDAFASSKPAFGDPESVAVSIGSGLINCVLVGLLPAEEGPSSLSM